MPIYMNYPIPEISGLQRIDILADTKSPHMNFFLESIAVDLQVVHPGGCNKIVIGPATHPGWNTFAADDGTLSVLIGLLLPAVQKIREAANKSSIIGVLRPALAPGGAIFIAGADGKLTQVQP